MATDTFVIRVDTVEGRDVVFTAVPFASLTGVPQTRSFVVMLVSQRGGPVSLAQSLDEGWHRAHVDEVVTGLSILRVVGNPYENLLRKQALDHCVPTDHLRPRTTIRATMATEALAALFVPGTSGGTTAFDLSVEPDGPRVPIATEPPPIDTDPGWGDAVVRALPALLPGWVPAPGQAGPGACRVVRAGDRVTLALEVRPKFGAPYVRGALEVAATLTVPELARLPIGKVPFGPATVARGQLNPSVGVQWARRWRPVPLETYDEWYLPAGLDEVAFETPDQLAARLAAEILNPAIDALLTPAGLLAYLEAELGEVRREVRPKAFAPLVPGPAPALGPTWRFHWEREAFWQRIALHLAFGDPVGARAALDQALSKWKTPPSHAALVASVP